MHVKKWMSPRELGEDRGKMYRAERQWGCYPQEPAQLARRRDRFLRAVEFGRYSSGMFAKDRAGFCKHSAMRCAR